MTNVTPGTPGNRRAVFSLDRVEWRDAENGRSDDYTVVGHAAVFNSLSDDLGGFRELLEPGAFRTALDQQPDVRLLFNHDPNYVMARTASGTLELREDPDGLRVWARVPPLSWITDLRTSMSRGDIDQMSFAFTLADEGDDWAVADDGTVVRTIRADGINELFDVSIVTYPAYTRTDAAMREHELRSAVEHGRLPASVLGEPDPTDATANISSAGETPRTDGGGVNRRLIVARRKALLAIERTPTNRKDNA